MNLSKIAGLLRIVPASKDEIKIVEKQLNIQLPKTYKELLMQSNGLSTNSGLVIYGTNDIVERNITLEVNEYAQGYIAIGDDSGDTVFLISKDNSQNEILSVGCGDMNPSNAKIIAFNLIKWLDGGCYIDKQNKTQIHNKKFSILLIDNPNNGLRDLIKIKNILNVDISYGKLLEASNNLPFCMISGISHGKALNYLEKLDEYREVLLIRSLDNC